MLYYLWWNEPELKGVNINQKKIIGHKSINSVYTKLYKSFSRAEVCIECNASMKSIKTKAEMVINIC